MGKTAVRALLICIFDVEWVFVVPHK